MTWPVPVPGLVIRYSYLWDREAREGREEGTKDRPCAVILALRDQAGRSRVFVLPITHSPPASGRETVEIPAVVKARLGLDEDRSWIVVDEVNAFTWPGPDLRFQPGQGPESASYGVLPPRFLRFVRERFLATDRAGKVARVSRTE